MFKDEIRKILQFTVIIQSKVLHLLCPNVSIVDVEVCRLCKQTSTRLHPAFTCSMSTIDTLEQDVKYVQR